MIETARKMIRKYSVSFLVYALLGGLCALVEWAVFYGASRLWGMHYITASLLGFVVATALNYALSCRIGFRSSGRSSTTAIAMVYAASLVGLGINLLVMIGLVEMAGVNSMAGKILGTGVAFGWNFIARQFLIFSSVPRWGTPASDGCQPGVPPLAPLPMPAEREARPELV